MPPLGADHARPELPHQEVAGLLVDVEDHLVPAAVAHDLDRSNAVLAHVREIYRLETCI
jgi:hypothetical protein